MDKTTLQILKAIPQDKEIYLVDLYNKLLGTVPATLIQESIPCLEKDGWITKRDVNSESNYPISITYQGVRALNEGIEELHRFYLNTIVSWAAIFISFAALCFTIWKG